MSLSRAAASDTGPDSTTINSTAPDNTGFDADGFWLTGQCFDDQPLVTLWPHWCERRDGLSLAASLDRGEILVDGQRCHDASLVLRAGQGFAFWLPGHQEGPADTRWQLLWQSHELMAVHKPPGLAVSRTTRNTYDTLINLVRRQSPATEAHLLHRLDAETSGILVLAKHSAANKRWKKRFDRLLQRKCYLALVYGQPDWQQLDFECYLAERRDSPIRCQMHVVDPEQDQTACVGAAKLSRTLFQCLASQAGMTLVQCELKSGRKHQLRTQLAALGHPIVADKIYAHGGRYYLQRLQQALTPAEIADLGASHHLLHAWQIELNAYGQRFDIQDDQLSEQWPAWVQQWLKRTRSQPPL
ncbi:RNA pseudouridine synthase [Oceanobacter sp. 5_MG-2023]|uniref:RluA family pseudouridine synthase n=1 Tax=Oceanobacter sp. 5_MG-2023 TaxID=3062645 RepID=UPI0026E3E942|nr:RNA pseudouridine synthase [Oceanobacter sp. 5_MG-2023]MDO6682304.1 RNA pseudouridine synthase [Oceanobacter sp. 5_MG-2023]